MKTRPDLNSTIGARSANIETNSSGKSSGDGPLAAMHREFCEFIDDMDDIAQKSMLLNLSGEDLKDIRERLSARVKQAKVSVEESSELMAASIQRYARKALSETSDYVRDRPWQSVAIGTAIGMALGLIVVYRKSLVGKF